MTAERKLEPFREEAVANTFQSYPDEIRGQLMALRQLVFDVASGSPDIGDIEETLKWGEPSYLTPGGSTLRLGWRESRPEQYAMYFNCNSKLVDTFKEVFAASFNFEGNRAIVFHKNETLPLDELRQSILLTLQYHKRKKLPLLGL